jgi:hypothetical protein
MVQYAFRASTAEVNTVLEEAVAAHTPPFSGSVRLKFYYATQAAAKPPTFVVFANRPDSVHFSYRRFLVNRLRDAFGLELVPVKIHFRPRHEPRPSRVSGQGPKGKKPTAKKPVAKTPAGGKPTARKPAANGPAGGKPAAGKKAPPKRGAAGSKTKK